MAKIGTDVFGASEVLLSAAAQGMFVVEGCQVLELGCGAYGSVGRSIAQLWPTALVTLSDSNPRNVEMLRKLTGGERCRVELLDLTSDAYIDLLGGVDVMLGSDIVCDDVLSMRELAHTIASLLHDTAEAWIAGKRSVPGLVTFLEELGKEGLHWTMIDYSDAVSAHLDKFAFGAEEAHIVDRDDVYLIRVWRHSLPIDLGEFGTAKILIPKFQHCQSSADRTGVHIWGSNGVLLSAAAKGTFQVDGLRVLELGCGAHGVVGRAIAQLWPSTVVTLSDGVPEFVEALRKVTSGERCQVELLDWTNEDSALRFGEVDLILGSDIVYRDASIMKALARTIRSLLHGEAEAWIAGEERVWADAPVSALTWLLEELGKQGLHWTKTACSDEVWASVERLRIGADSDGPSMERDRVFLLRVWRHILNIDFFSVGAARVSIPKLEHLTDDATGAHIWGTTGVLLSAVAESIFKVEGLKVLELGCGVHGIVGRAIAQLWPSTVVTLSDGMPDVLEALQNAVVGERCIVKLLDWTRAEDICRIDDVDIVLGSDIVYHDAPLMRALADTINSLLHGKAQAWLAVEHCGPALDWFLEELGNKGMDWTKVECSDAVWAHVDRLGLGADSAGSMMQRNRVFLLQISQHTGRS